MPSALTGGRSITISAMPASSMGCLIEGLLIARSWAVAGQTRTCSTWLVHGGTRARLHRKGRRRHRRQSRDRTRIVDRFVAAGAHVVAVGRHAAEIPGARFVAADVRD